MWIALGTEFNVKAYLEDEWLIASLIEGKARVDCNDTLSYVLNPGNQVVYNKISHSGTMQPVSVQDVTAWQRGQIVLTKATVNEIVRTLERHFGMAFHVLEENRTMIYIILFLMKMPIYVRYWK